MMEGSPPAEGVHGEVAPAGAGQSAGHPAI